VKITKLQLKRIIKEELESVLAEQDSPCIELVGIELENMKRKGIEFSEDQKQQVYAWAREQVCSARRLNLFRRKLELKLRKMSQG
jgi:hypothetical protein